MDNTAWVIYYTDDDKDDQEMFIYSTRQVAPHIQVKTQNSGEELMDLLLSEPSLPELIFLDLNMPKKNGLEVLKELKEMERLNSVPVIIFSTSNDSYSINTTKQCGADMFISKPGSYALLKKAIAYIISLPWKTSSPTGENFVYKAN